MNHEPTFDSAQAESTTRLDPEAQRYVVATVREAFEQAMYGEGLAIVKQLGVPENVRESVHRLITQEEYDDDGEFPGVVRYWCGFEPVDIYPITSAIFNAEPAPIAQDIIICNVMYKVYLTGGMQSPHYDFGVAGEAYNKYFDEQAVTILYVTKGEKQLEVWPEGQDEKSGHQGILIDQSPDMLICLRGGAVLHEGVLRPAIRHAVPPVDHENAILTFDLTSPREREDDD